MARTYFDFDFRGTIENNGALKEYRGSQAVANAVKAWMASFKGEVLRKPKLGGPLINLLMKPMSESIASVMREEITILLRSEFVPRIITKKVEVIPNYEGDFYEIRVTGYCPAIKDKVSFSESYNRL